MKKNVMGSQNENGNNGTQPFDSKLDFKDVYSFTWEKMTALNPKNGSLLPIHLTITKIDFWT